MRSSHVSLPRRALVLFGLWLSLGLGVAAADQTVCEMPEAYDRGVGRVPDRCPAGQQKQAGLCYPACDSGYDGVGPVCWQRCRSGYHDDGATCRRDVSIKAADTRACPWYDACGLTFARGCSTCPAGYHNDGCTCRRDAHIYGKRSYGRGVGRPMICRSRYEMQAGLCYTPCDEGHLGVATSCLPTCPPDAPESCGDGICASEERFCEHAWAHAEAERFGTIGEAQRAHTPVYALLSVWRRPATDPRRPDEPDPDAGFPLAWAEVEDVPRPSPAEQAFAARVAEVAEAHGYRTDGADQVAEAVFDSADPWHGRLDWHALTDLDILMLVDRFTPPVCWSHEDMPRRLLRVALEAPDAMRDMDAFVWSDSGVLGNSALTIADRDGDGISDARDGCPDHGNKAAPGECGCDLADEQDRDGDGMSDCYGTITVHAEPPSWGVWLDGVRQNSGTSIALPIGTEVEALGARSVSVRVDGQPCPLTGGGCRFVVTGDMVVEE